MGGAASYTAHTAVEKYPQIQRNLRLLDESDLEYTFAVGDKHPQMIIYKSRPTYDDDAVVTVDLVYEFENKNDNASQKLNVVRFQVAIYFLECIITFTIKFYINK